MTLDYDSIIEFENENSSVDFKAIQYDKNSHGELLKDVIAMANADVEGDRIIIIGIKHKPDGSRDIRPIIDNEFIDSATYQQLGRENIEPDLSIDYVPHYFKGKLLGLLKIQNCDNQPYMFKKDFSKFKKGDCYIRKGSHQLRISRSDLDRIYNKKKKYFDDNVVIGFSGTNYSQEITLTPMKNIELPSKTAAKIIRRILEEKKKQQALPPQNYRDLLSQQMKEAAIRPLFGSVPYENRSIATLENDLNKVEETYRKDDLYEILETQSFRLNFDILNNADEYIQDATVCIEIKKDASFNIPNRILEKPRDNSILPSLPPFHNFISNYPNVELIGEIIHITSEVGEIKHRLKSSLLCADIRLAIFKKPVSGEIPITIKLYAKNIAIPLERKLRIRIEEN
ncbi:MAG: ATP-binding protein [Smithellaceae bacterium]